MSNLNGPCMIVQVMLGGLPHNMLVL